MAENFFGLTDTGKIRDNNEDTFIAQFILNKRYVLACVIDGVGGYHGGEVAAAVAREEILKELEKNKGDLIPEMIAAFKQANSKILKKKKEDKDYEQMACVATLVVADIQNNQFTYAHVGDTRLYLLRDGSLVKISKDHSFVGYLEDSGRITETAAMKHPKRNEINKALGFNEQIATDDSYIETGQSPFLSGDILLLCSDGLSDLVDKKEITDLVTSDNSLEQKATALIEAANNNGGSDNITVVLVKNDKASQRANATMPAAVPTQTNIKADKEIMTMPENKLQVAVTNQGHAKSNTNFTLIFGLLSLVLLVLTIWFYLQWQKYKPDNQKIANDARAPRNEQEMLLQDALNNPVGDSVVLSDTVFKSPIIISDTLFIKGDSLHIKAKGNIVLLRDTAYHGPALVISPSAKVTLLDSLQFNGFATTIYLNNTALLLKSIRFINSAVPIKNFYRFNDKSNITARVPVIMMSVDSTISRMSSNGTK